MTIEGGNKVVNHKPVTGDTTRMGKGKGAAGGAFDALGGAGADFSALLNSFDSEFVDEDAIAPQLAMDQPAPASQPPLDPQPNLLPQILPTDLQLLLAQASEVSVDKSNSLPSATLGTQSSDPLTPMITSTADFAASSTQVSLAQGSPVNSPTLPGLAVIEGLSSLSPKAVPAADMLSIAGGPAEVDVPTKAVPVAGRPNIVGGPAEVDVPAELLLIQPAQGLQLRPLKSRVVEGLPSVGGAMADPRTQATSALADVMNREVDLMGALVASGLGEGLTLPGERGGGHKPSFSWAGSGAEGLWGQQPFQAGPAIETVSVPSGSPAPSMESMVADTVSYWVTQGVKHAALKLEGFGEQPLEVSISMQGGEAQIAFRTDQPEIRQILEGAMTHLTDLLKSEGVVLSGVSVGASGQNGGGRQDERNRSGARQGTVVTTKSLSLDSPRPVNLPAGRVLDLFV